MRIPSPALVCAICLTGAALGQAEPAAPERLLADGERAILATAAGPLSARVEAGAAGRVLILLLPRGAGMPVEAELPVAHGQRHRIALPGLDHDRPDLVVEVTGGAEAILLSVGPGEAPATGLARREQSPPDR